MKPVSIETVTSLNSPGGEEEKGAEKVAAAARTYTTCRNATTPESSPPSGVLMIVFRRPPVFPTSIIRAGGACFGEESDFAAHGRRDGKRAQLCEPETSINPGIRSFPYHHSF